MKQIKFSHRYQKLHMAMRGEHHARLLDCWPVNMNQFSPQFLQYDTDELWDFKGTGTDYLLLVFLDHYGIFTTLRPRNPEKEIYYGSAIGEHFQIIYPTE